MEPPSNVLQAIKFHWRRFRIYLSSPYTFVNAWNLYGIPASDTYQGKKRPSIWSIIALAFIAIPYTTRIAVAVVNNTWYHNDEIDFWFHNFGKALGGAGDMFMISILIYSSRTLFEYFVWHWILRDEKMYKIIQGVLCHKWVVTGESLSKLELHVKRGGQFCVIYIRSVIGVCILQTGVMYAIVVGERVQHIWTVVMVCYLCK